MSQSIQFPPFLVEGRLPAEERLLSKCSSLVTKTHAAHKLLEPRFGAEGIEARSQEDTRIKSFFIAFFGPIYRLSSIPESCVDDGNLRSMRRNQAGILLQIVQ